MSFGLLNKNEVFHLLWFNFGFFNTYSNLIFKTISKIKNLNFFRSSRDPLGAGYQITQSKIAIGSGGFFEGFPNGSQSYLDYLPEKHTDFIFTLFSESLVWFIYGLHYMVMTMRIVSIGNMVRDTFWNILLHFRYSLFRICSCKYGNGSRFNTHCGRTFTHTILRWIFNDGDDAGFRDSYEL